MSFEDIAKFKEQVELKNVRQVVKGDLILFNYTDQCIYAKAWDTRYTRDARGIVYNQVTGELVARPFPKFFNLGEMPETMLLNLPDEPYEVFEKVDGSLGIIYWHNDRWNVATRGSFESEQAVKAEDILKKYNIDSLNQGVTFLVEIIYPSNKIVVNYGDEEKLVMLGAYIGERELSTKQVAMAARHARMSLAQSFTHSIEDMIALQQTIPKDQEGFVVRFASGLRAKIKGAEYMKIHKMIANMSPLSFWESMENGIVNKEYLAQLPEEFRATYEPMVAQLEQAYSAAYNQITVDAARLPASMSLKEVGLAVQDGTGLTHPTAVFPYRLGKTGALNKYIMKHIRPHGNILS